MIDARDVYNKIRLPLHEEAEVQRLGEEIVRVMNGPKFDGRPFSVDVPAGEDDDQREQALRIAYALQQRFVVKNWFVQMESVADAFGMPQAHRLHFAIDPTALRVAMGVAAGVVGGEVSRPTTAAGFSLRGLHDELSTLFGGSSEDVSVPILPAKPVLSILLGTYNRLAHLKCAIASMRRSIGDVPYEVVVCDGGSTDGSRQWLAQQPDVLLVGEWRLDGAVRAFNQAFTLCRGEFVANLNDDCVVHGRALLEGVSHLRSNPQAGQVAFAFSGRAQPKRGINDVYPQREHPRVTWPTTYANFGITRKSVADQVAYIQGGFWNPVYRTYAGDVELSAWIWKLGFTVDKRPDLYVEDVWAEDGLRERNVQGSGTEAKRMYARWSADAFRFDGPDPRVSSAEILRFRAIRGGRDVVAAIPVETDVVEVFAEKVGFPEPQEERRLRKLAPLLRALDPTNTFPKRAEKVGIERVLHVHINGEKAVDQQEGLVRALRGLGSGGYEMVRWTDFNYEERQEKILEAAKRLSPTLIFMQLQTANAVGAETIRMLREIAPEAVIATWCGDIASENRVMDVEWQVQLGRLVDLTLHSSMTHVRALRAAGVTNSSYLQIGYDDAQYNLPGVDALGCGVNDDFQRYAVCFLGSKYGSGDVFSMTYNWKNGMPAHDSALRDEVVAKMRETFGVRFGLFGSGWDVNELPCLAGMKKGPCDCPPIPIVPVTKSHEIYWRSRIGLSISLDNKLENYTSDRLFRILACGAILLVKRFPGMEMLGLQNDVNCAIWDTADEAVEIAKRLVGSDEFAHGIAASGAKLARDNHSWDVRMKELQPYLDVVRYTRSSR